jgi:hypothetical protein
MKKDFFKLLSYIPLVVLAFGIIGYLINICIFAKKKMRSYSSTFRFLMYLSITDLFVLLFGATEFIVKSDFSLNVKDSSLFSCNIQKFLIYTFTHISSCISIAVTIDRAKIISKIEFNQIANVSQALSPQIFSTPSNHKSKNNLWLCKSKCTRVDCISIIIVLLSILLNSHFLIFLSKSSLIYIDENDYLRAWNKFSMNKSMHHIFRCVPEKNSFYEFFLLHSWFWIDLFLI